MVRIVAAPLLRGNDVVRAGHRLVSGGPSHRRNPMIIEMRTYTLQPGTVAQFEERFGAALAVRAKLSPLAAFWHTEVGPLNRVIHVWPYKDFEERTRVRAESQKLQGWPPSTREFVVEQQSEVFLPAPFSPKLEPRQLGGLYEIRLYTLKPGGIPGVIDRWSTAIAERVKLSPLAFAGHSEFGGLNRWCHIWAYKDAAERFAVRERARNEGIWPPKGGQPGATLKQENMLVVPASFSPLPYPSTPQLASRYSSGGQRRLRDLLQPRVRGTHDRTK